MMKVQNSALTEADRFMQRLHQRVKRRKASIITKSHKTKSSMWALKQNKWKSAFMSFLADTEQINILLLQNRITYW